ncbi:MAG: glucosamine-6-phosphate deaminase [Bacillota bacterium]|nr:glucosamine-6-phosphate deaminase [Bacillota bacterium]
MRIIVCDDYDGLSLTAAKMIASQILLKPNSVLGLATGSTPVGTYNILMKMYADGETDFKDVLTFNLDEYYPIRDDNPQSYHYFMKEHLFSKININPSNVHILNGTVTDAAAECKTFERLIKKSGGIDLQLLGIGKNGHIGFNEPEANLNAGTHLTKLTQSTIEANSRFFENVDDVPTHALTMGIATILRSKKIVLLASGEEKQHIISSLLEGGISTAIPATMLKVHPDVTIICDRAAYKGV